MVTTENNPYSHNRMYAAREISLCKLCDEREPTRAFDLQICATCAFMVWNVMAPLRGFAAMPKWQSEVHGGRPPESRDPVTGHVYYIRRGDLIKIGFTTDLNKRMMSHLPDEVLAVEPGSYALEASRHRQFATLRHGRGEWFKDDPALREHIAGLVKRHGEPPLLPTLKDPTPHRHGLEPNGWPPGWVDQKPA